MFRDFAVMLMGILMIAGCQAQQTKPSGTQDDVSKTAAGTSEAEKIPISENTSVNTAAMAGLSWWHRDDIVEEISLDAEQQEKMDQHLTELLARWQENVGMRKGARVRYSRALEAAKFDDARKIAEDYGKAQGFFTGGALVLKTKILAELRPEQLKILWEKHAKLMKGRWIGSGQIKAQRQPG